MMNLWNFLTGNLRKMNKVNLYFKTYCDRLRKCSNNERNLEQQKIFCNENLNIEDLQKSLRGSSIEKSPNYFMTGISRKYTMTIYLIWPFLLAFPVRCLAIPSMECNNRDGFFIYHKWRKIYAEVCILSKKI